MGKFWLPPIPPKNVPTEFSDVTSIVIIGANGSGKSRLGAWIKESSGKDSVVHRISAQRALTINNIQTVEFRIIDPTLKSRSNPITHMAADFEMVLAWLFAEHSELAVEFRERSKLAAELRERSLTGIGDTPPIGESKLEAVLRLWHKVMPQRKLILKKCEVTAQMPGTHPYAGREMSDGERVALYLIAHCLVASQGSTIVLDEPELHLHQAIQARLWDQIEDARPDCVFVYITHDLSFAASRTTAKKFWIRDYDGKQGWNWQEVSPTEQFPESMLLQIIGSRRPILFVEGKAGGLDEAVYRALYPDRLVIPRSSCRGVIESTTALSSLPQLHHADAYGIIDRDHRSDTEIASYVKDRVFVPNVSEIENLFLVPEAIRHASAHLKRDPASDLTEVQDFLFGELKKEFAVQVNDRATFQVQQRLNSFSRPKDHKGGAVAFKRAVEEYLSSIDSEAIYAESETLFQGILDQRDYPGLLRHYNQKSLASRISRNLGLRDREYPKLVLRLLREDDGDRLRADLKSWLPSIPAEGGETG